MEPETYTFIKRNVKTLLNIDLTSYKEEQMKRRLDSWLSRSGQPSWVEYFRYVRGHETELNRLRDYLTINVSAFFRDLPRWHDLRQQVVPELLQHRARLRVWSAGCSIGVEAYSLAILLDEHTARRHAILATDLDRGALTKARARGPYTDQDMREVTAAQRARYFEPQGPPWQVSTDLARRVVFQEQNLLTDPFENDFDLIVCRNVVIYFTDAAKEILWQKFHAALRPGGILFVGGTELLSPTVRGAFQSCGISFYRKP